MNSHHKGLYRSSNQTVIGGVAAGIAEHLNTDPIIIRIIFSILALFGGGVLIYVILWIVLPSYETTHFEVPNPPSMKNKNTTQNTNIQYPVYHRNKENGSLIVGIFMITIGFIFLVDHFLHIGFRHLWPILLLVVGILLIKSAYDKPKSFTKEDNQKNLDCKK
jgi:phage shock protein PspC (stress-responsive transcriptional regulator)